MQQKISKYCTQLLVVRSYLFPCLSYSLLVPGIHVTKAPQGMYYLHQGLSKHQEVGSTQNSTQLSNHIDWTTVCCFGSTPMTKVTHFNMVFFGPALVQ